MGLRCDVFGHDFGAPTIDEVREESDQGTLLVVREYETCRRCGAEHELSENRGLISQAPEPTDNATPSGESDGRQAGAVEASERRGATDEGSGTQTADGSPAGGQDDESRGNGSSAGAASETDNDDGSTAAAGEVTSSPTDPGGPTVSESGMADNGAASPEAPQLDDAKSHGEATAPEASRLRDEPDRSDAEGGQNATFPPPASEIPDGDGGSDGTYRCPRCEYEVPVSNASFCRGDVCPECHVGYIERVEKP